MRREENDSLQKVKKYIKVGYSTIFRDKVKKHSLTITAGLCFLNILIKYNYTILCGNGPHPSDDAIFLAYNQNSLFSQQ